MEASSPRRNSRPAPAEESETNLESLPPEIHGRIVSLLPVRDAVRTSAVCRAWRRIWESAPGLAHDWGYGADPAHADAVLARYTRPVRSFGFDLHKPSFRRADDWVPLLAGKEVQMLRLHFSYGRNIDPHYLDESIFSCRDLTRLDLIGCEIPAAPVGLAGFPNLTELYLYDVGFPDNGVRGLEAMIAESPLLQLLWLDKLWLPEDEDEDEDEDEEEDGHGFECWVIQAPNLRNLSIVCDDDNGWQIEELLYIEKVEISSDNYDTDRDFLKLLTSVARVRELCLKMPLRASSALEGLSCTFENLKSLSLHTDFCSLPTILSTLCLLQVVTPIDDVVLVEDASDDEENPVADATVDGPILSLFEAMTNEPQPPDDPLSLRMPSVIITSIRKRKSYDISSVRRSARIAQRNTLRRLGIIGNNGKIDEDVIQDYADYLKELPPPDVLNSLMRAKGRAFWDLVAGISLPPR